MPPKLQYKGSASWAAPGSSGRSPSPVKVEGEAMKPMKLQLTEKTSSSSSGAGGGAGGSPSGSAGSAGSPGASRPGTPRGKLERCARPPPAGSPSPASRRRSLARSVAAVFSCCIREAPHAEYSILSRDEAHESRGAPLGAETEPGSPWAQDPYGAPPKLPALVTRRVCCCSYTRGPTAAELRGRQRWLRGEIDEKESALAVVRDDMRSLLSEADDLAIQTLALKEKVCSPLASQPLLSVTGPCAAAGGSRAERA